MERQELIICMRYMSMGDEKQVDFLRDTSFMVTKVEETKGTPYRKYYLKELSDA